MKTKLVLDPNKLLGFKVLGIKVQPDAKKEGAILGAKIGKSGKPGILGAKIGKFIKSPILSAKIGKIGKITIS